MTAALFGLDPRDTADRKLVAFAVSLDATAGVAGLYKVVTVVVHSRQLELCTMTWTEDAGVPTRVRLAMRIEGHRVETVRQWLLRCVDVLSVEDAEASFRPKKLNQDLERCL